MVNLGLQIGKYKYIEIVHVCMFDFLSSFNTMSISMCFQEDPGQRYLPMIRQVDCSQVVMMHSLRTLGPLLRQNQLQVNDQNILGINLSILNH